jgi:hypothetical protein
LNASLLLQRFHNQRISWWYCILHFEMFVVFYFWTFNNPDLLKYGIYCLYNVLNLHLHAKADFLNPRIEATILAYYPSCMQPHPNIKTLIKKRFIWEPYMWILMFSIKKRLKILNLVFKAWMQKLNNTFVKSRWCRK